MCRLFSSLSLPLEPNKLEGPASCLTFLGIEVDMVNRQLCLPAEKMERLDKELKATRERSSGSCKVSQVYCSTLVKWSDKVEPSFRGSMPCRVWDPPLLTISD